ncbi:MAG: class I SAM-dependent methyltransferase, partial [Thermomicrobium sp.]|nr:class I SAM-dependent methyltransferase [Thermomicrobium sp.]
MGRAVRRLIASILELFYGPLAPLYPALTKFLFADAWQEWQRSVHRWIPAAGRVLELGCGPGDLAAFLAERGHVVIALDRSAAMARLARRRTKGAQRVQVVRADMRWLPVGDSTVDTVVTTFPTAAFLDDRTSHEIARVLREGGLLIAVLAGWPRR